MKFAELSNPFIQKTTQEPNFNQNINKNFGILNSTPLATQKNNINNSSINKLKQDLKSSNIKSNIFEKNYNMNNQENSNNNLDKSIKNMFIENSTYQSKIIYLIKYFNYL